MSKPLVLLAIDGPEERQSLATRLGAANIACQMVGQPTELIAAVGQTHPAALIVDVGFGGESVLELLSGAKQHMNGTPLIFRARRSTADLELALEVSQRGAGLVLLAPHDEQQLKEIIQQTLSHFELQRDGSIRKHEACIDVEPKEIEGCRGEDRSHDLDRLLIGSSRAISEIRTMIGEVANTRASVLIRGEAGTGKELVARAIHQNSPRREHPFVVVNTAAFPAGEAEIRLFGGTNGSPGADCPHPQGIFETTSGGTIFLDELGDFEVVAQPALLRVLEQQLVGPEKDEADVRLIAATSHFPHQLINQGRLREDLFFHLHVVPISLPPLRSRSEDIPLLADHFLREATKIHQRPVEAFHKETLAQLKKFSWPGNVRQLRNVVERMVIFAEGPVLQPCHIPADLRVGPLSRGEVSTSEPTKSLHNLTPLQHQERLLIIDALRQTNDNVVDAAGLLRMGQATVYRKIRQYQISHSRPRRKPV